VYDKLFNTFGLWRERPQEIEGLRARLASRVALHNFWHMSNTRFLQPSGRSPNETARPNSP
jgi:hypothetical protein